MVSGIATVTFDTEANAMYYKLSSGRAVKSRKLRQNRFDYAVDFDAKGEVIGVEVLNMKKALALAASESALLLAPLRATAPKRPR
jgi:uncharacterized protein YuzE